MRKIREWMHGKGKTPVMLIVVVVAMIIVVNYFMVERNGVWGIGKYVTPTATPARMEDTIIGGSSIGSKSDDVTITTGDAISTETKN